MSAGQMHSTEQLVHVLLVCLTLLLFVVDKLTAVLQDPFAASSLQRNLQWAKCQG